MAPITSALTRVLITGFGPFQNVVNNPSWAIASRLPATLPGNIELLVHPSYIPVAYHPVIDTVPDLIADIQPDIALHIGVAEGRTYFAVEQTSRKGVYITPDVDGQKFTNAEGEAIWGDQPTSLSTALDLQAVVAEWQNRTQDIVWPEASSSSGAAARVAAKAPVEVAFREDVFKVEAEGFLALEGDDVRWSDNVGTYLCGFIFYTSMVAMSRESVGGRRDTAFLHVPGLYEEAEIEMGVDVTVELVQSLVASWRAQRAAEGAA